MNWRLALAAWVAGLPGVLSLAWLVLPGLVAGRPLPVAMWVLQVSNAAQSAVLLGAAVVIGAALAPKVGLTAPGFQALTSGGSIVEALRPQLWPGLWGGLAGGLVLWLFTANAPGVLAEVQTRFSVPAVVRVLYGGITEELLIRFGLMTVLLWALGRWGPTGAGVPSAAFAYAAIGVSALLFGAGHLPSVWALAGPVSTNVALYVVLANGAFGLVAGWLYWRFGLESAIVAHALAHLLFLAVSRGAA